MKYFEDDYHTITAAQTFKIPIKCVTKEQREFGKRLNFAMAYGMGPAALRDMIKEYNDKTNAKNICFKSRKSGYN